MTTSSGVAPLVILGFDAGDPDLLEQWAREGSLPTVSSVRDRGFQSRTRGVELIAEHGAWLSLFSGVSRGKHGYHYYRQLVPGTYDLRSVTARDVDVQPFWARLRSSGIRAAVVDVPDVEPIPGVEGLQVANWGVHNASFPPSVAVTPPADLRAVRDLVGRGDLIPESTEATFDEDRRIYRRLLDRARRKGELCRRLLADERYDLVVVVFGESHTGAHQLWKYRRTEDLPADSAELAGGIKEIYREIDRQMGAVLGELPSDCNVVVVSSVGMRDRFPTIGLMEAFCRRLGYQADPGTGGGSARSRMRLRDAIPKSWRERLGRRLPGATRERLLAESFRTGTDWTRTTAFSIPSSFTGLVRVNLAGREPLGTVEPGSPYKRLLDRIEADLAQLTDPETGAPAIELVLRTVDAFGAAPPNHLPDLFVHWKPTTGFVRSVRHGRALLEQQRPDFFRDSDHSREGFVAAAGPDIDGPHGGEGIDVLDLAPTFLSLLGEPVPDDLGGAPAAAMLREGLLRSTT